MSLDLHKLAEEVYGCLFIAHEADDNDEKDGLKRIEEAFLRVQEETRREDIEVANNAINILRGIERNTGAAELVRNDLVRLLKSPTPDGEESEGVVIDTRIMCSKCGYDSANDEPPEDKEKSNEL
jgi:hypothetical protein